MQQNLSLSKLVGLVTQRGFAPTKYIKYKGLCIFIEIVSLASGSVGYIYIPSRFDFPIGEGEDVLEVDLVDPNADPDEYTNDPELAKKIFAGIDITSVNDNQNQSQQLKERYRKQIHLRTGASGCPETLKDIIRQQDRLHYCMEDLPYHLVVAQDAYICFMRGGEADCYIIKNHRGTLPRVLRVTAELPVFHKRASTLDGEMSQIYAQIGGILDSNLSKHARYMDTLSKKKDNMHDFSNLIQGKKNRLHALMRKYELLLVELDQREKSLQRSLEMNGSTQDGRLAGDLTYARNKATLERQIAECLTVKKDVISNLLSLKGDLDQISLSADKVMFDNSVMMSKVFENFDKLVEICK